MVDPLFDLDADVVDKEPKRSPGSFRLFGRSWDRRRPRTSTRTFLTATRTRRVSCSASCAGSCRPTSATSSLRQRSEAYEAEDVSLPSLQKITTKLAAVFENREQRRTAKRAGRPYWGAVGAQHIATAMADDVLGVLIAGGQNPASLSLREWCAVTWRIVTEHAEPEDRALYSAVFNATSRKPRQGDERTAAQAWRQGIQRGPQGTDA
ncbi:MAG: hypothetical protein IPN02_08040 [Candidatus Microthrix sp.]|uniref:Uncharacterized protein n=1 Tax=Candidatus Neomicrothrix subdominans TaxID=2954438 RepID=A0A936NDD1_9ACTN|nr:hypothetical protein [Candidatus Microthrix subdominans]